MKFGPSGKDGGNFIENEDSKENNFHGQFKRNKNLSIAFRIQVKNEEKFNGQYQKKGKLSYA